jgi:ribosomal protein L35
MAKSKMKKHKATMKVLKVRPGGTISYKHAEGNHKTNKDTSKQVRQRRKKGTLSKGDYNRLKSVI